MSDKIKLEPTKKELTALVTLVNDFDAMLGCGEDTNFIAGIKAFDKMLKRSGLARS